MTTPALTQGARLARSAFWNVLGQLLPLGVAVFAIPRLMSGIGMERFGLLTLAWVLIGYFSLFDLGLSSALTRLVAERIGMGRAGEVPPLVGTALAAMTAFGVAGGLLLMGLAPWLSGAVLHVPAGLQGEMRSGIVVLACSLPLVTCTAGLFGVLGAIQRFDLVSAVRIPMGVAFFAGPLLALRQGPALPLVFGTLALVRALGAVGALAAVLVAMPSLRRRPRVHLALLPPLLRFGGWMTISGVVGPLMLYLDRFVIGSLRTLPEVAWYATPYEVTSRVLLFATPVAMVLFPAFAASHGVDRPRTRVLFEWGSEAVPLALFPAVLALAAFAPELLNRWIGPAAASHSAAVMRLLALGVFVNGGAQIALALVQSCGRPDLSARLHLIELPLYLVILVLLTRAFGPVGAALAWTLRVIVDALVLSWLSERLLTGAPGRVATRGLATLAGAGLLITVSLVPSLEIRAIVAVVGVTVAAWLAWRRIAPRLRQILDLRSAGA